MHHYLLQEAGRRKSGIPEEIVRKFQYEFKNAPETGRFCMIVVLDTGLLCYNNFSLLHGALTLANCEEFYNTKNR